MRSLSLSLISITGGGRLGVLTQPDSKVPGDQQRWYKFSRYFFYILVINLVLINNTRG